MSIRVFFSHSSSDEKLAHALIKLLQAALALPHDEIRCTSVPGYRLSTGVETDKELLKELLEATAFIALLTPHSLTSTYVLFELGARWGAKLTIFPLLAAGASAKMLKGPLTAINARRCDSSTEIHHLIADVAKELKVRVGNPGVYDSELSNFLKLGATLAEQPHWPLAPQETNSPVTAKGMTYCSARDICSRIRKAPPLQATELASEFIGCLIDWEVTYSDASPGEHSDSIRLSLRPWEPHGYDTNIRCETTLSRNPELKAMEKETPMRVEGRIAKADSWAIDLVDTIVSQMSGEERHGTRIRFVCEDVRLELGFQQVEKLECGVIEDSIKAQIQMQRPAGLSIVEDRKIVPEIADGSTNHRLLVLYTVKHILLSSGSHSDKQRRDFMAEVERQIHGIENSPTCNSF